MLFMLFHAFLSKKSTLFEKYRLLVTRNPLYFSYAFCAFCAFLDIFLGEQWISCPLFGPLGPFLFHLWKFGPNLVLFSPFGPFLSIFGHIFWSIFGHLVVYFSCAFS